MKKKMWLTLILLTALILIVACSSKDNTTGSTGNSSGSGNGSGSASSSLEDSGSSEAIDDQFFEISYLGTNFHTSVEGDYAQVRLEEKLNIKINDVKVDRVNAQQMDLMIASGEIPDAAWLNRDPATLYYEHGATRTIPRHLIEEYAPNYASKVLDFYPIGWKLHASKENADELLALTGFFPDDALQMNGAYRLDWLEKVGISPKGNVTQLDEDGRIFMSDTPFTQEEFLTIMKAFTFNDPNGSGANDTYGFTANEMLFYSFDTLMGMFGLASSVTNVEQDGVTVEYFASENYKQWLRYMRELYMEGVIDPEFVTTPYEQYHEKIGLGKVGYFQLTYHLLNPANSHRAPWLFLNTDPDAKLLITPPEMGENGMSGTTRNWNPYRYSFHVGKDVSDEKLVRILQWFDYMYFDQEASVYTIFGEEGVNFNWSGEPYKSTPIVVQDAPKADDYNGNFIWLDNSWYFDETTVNARTFVNSEDWKSQYGLLPHRQDLFNETRYAELRAQHNASLETIRIEFMYQVITGEIELDAKWDSYIDDLNRSGMADMLVELQKAPTVQELISN